MPVNRFTIYINKFIWDCILTGLFNMLYLSANELVIDDGLGVFWFNKCVFISLSST